jgi:hypothetical protein
MHDGMTGTGGPPGQLTLLHGAVHLQEAVRRQALPDIRVANKNHPKKPTRNISERNKIDTQSRADAYILGERVTVISNSDYHLKSGCT